MNPSASAARGVFSGFAGDRFVEHGFPAGSRFAADSLACRAGFLALAFHVFLHVAFRCGSYPGTLGIGASVPEAMVPAGVLGFAMYSILMFEAGHTTDATNLSLIAATAPVFMAFFARFFLGERLCVTPVVWTGSRRFRRDRTGTAW